MTEENKDLNGSEAGSEAPGMQGDPGTTNEPGNELPVENEGLPEKYAGKTAEEIAKIADDNQKALHAKSQELGTVKQEVADIKAMLKKQNEAAAAANLPKPDGNAEMEKLLNGLNEDFKKNPAKAMMKAMMLVEQSKSKAEADPVLKDIKEDKLLNDQISALNDPLAAKHREDIRAIIVENGFPMDNPKAVEFAWSKYIAANIDSYLQEKNSNGTTPPEGGDPPENNGANAMQNHDAPKPPATNETGITFTDAEKTTVGRFMRLGVYKDENAAKEAVKEIDSLPGGTFWPNSVRIGNEIG